MIIRYLEYYIISIITALLVVLFSLFFFSNVPIVDASIKAVFIAAIVFIAIVFMTPTHPITIVIGAK